MKSYAYEQWTSGVTSQLRINAEKVAALELRVAEAEKLSATLHAELSHAKEKVGTVESWKGRVDEYVSPSQLEKLVNTVENHERTLNHLGS